MFISANWEITESDYSVGEKPLECDQASIRFYKIQFFLVKKKAKLLNFSFFFSAQNNTIKSGKFAV